MKRIPLPLLLPVGAAMFLATVGGGLGVLFMVLGERAAIVIGVLLAAGVPLVGALLARRLAARER